MDEGWEYCRRRVQKAIHQELLTLIIEQDWCECEMCRLVHNDGDVVDRE